MSNSRSLRIVDAPASAASDDLAFLAYYSRRMEADEARPVFPRDFTQLTMPFAWVYGMVTADAVAKELNARWREFQCLEDGDVVYPVAAAQIEGREFAHWAGTINEWGTLFGDDEDLFPGLTQAAAAAIGRVDPGHEAAREFISNLAEDFELRLAGGDWCGVRPSMFGTPAGEVHYLCRLGSEGAMATLASRVIPAAAVARPPMKIRRPAGRPPKVDYEDVLELWAAATAATPDLDRAAWCEANNFDLKKLDDCRDRVRQRRNRAAARAAAEAAARRSRRSS